VPYTYIDSEQAILYAPSFNILYTKEKKDNFFLKEQIFCQKYGQILEVKVSLAVSCCRTTLEKQTSLERNNLHWVF
jgi:hypothetical protein